MNLPGALVISLDFELHWGVRDHVSPTDPYTRNLRGEWQSVPAMLALFREFDVAATWAIVGFLFARNRDELSALHPTRRPRYPDGALDPYREPVGDDERDDPLHFAPSLIRRIADAPRQEIATHTYSHYYCLEPGQTREDFDADCGSAIAAAATWGIKPRSIVFPRNQHNPAYDDVLLAHGIVAYRGNPPTWMHRASAGEPSPWRRFARGADSYMPGLGDRTFPWSEVAGGNGLCNVRASFFVRPYSPRLKILEPLRIRRIADAIRRAAEARRIVHLWWHPHNFGVDTAENLRALRRCLEQFARMRERFGMQSLAMIDVTQRLGAGS